MIPILLLMMSFSGGEMIIQHIEFSEHNLRMTRAAEFTKIRLPDCEITDEVGAPELPVKSIKIALPYGAQVVQISVISSESKVIDGEFLVSCAQPPVILSNKEITEWAQPNDAIYQSDKPYPENSVEFMGMGIYDNHYICELLIYPVQYLPQSKKLIFYTALDFAVTYQGGIKKSSRRDVVKRIVLNSEDVSFDQRKPARGDFDYLIITNPPIDTVFQRLANWKTKKGLKTEIRTVNWILSNYSGEDDAATIRNYIKTLADSSTHYVLLAGDIDVVPHRLAYAMCCEYGGHVREDSLPCDLYYADLQGTWDLNNNGVYGEVEDSIDLYPDLFVGRAPVNTVAEAQKFVEKVLIYERYTAVDYLNNALFSADILWYNPYTDQGIHKNQIEAQSFSPDIEITKLYHSQGNLTPLLFKNALRQGQVYTNHDGHGWIDVMSAGTGYLHSEDFDTLTNAPHYGIIFSMGCWTAAFDFDAIEESFVNSPNGGGVAAIGNSSYGWGSPGNPGFGVSDRLDTRFCYSLFKEENFHLGEALALSKVYFIPRSREENVYRWHQYQLNLLGDPTLSVWTATPETLLVSYPQSVPIDGGRMFVTVKDKQSGFPIKGALVCLMKGSESYDAEYTDASGSVFLDAFASSAGDFDLTVTAHNYLAIETTIPVVSGSYVNYVGWILDDALGNDDGVVNPNEQVSLDLMLKNCGNAIAHNIQVRLRSVDSGVTIEDSAESIVSMNAGDSLFIDDAFRITTGSVDNGYAIEFELEVTDASKTLTYNPIIIVGTPVLSIREFTIEEPPSIPGDTESLNIHILNTGYGYGHAAWARLSSVDPYISIVVDSVFYGEIMPETTHIATQSYEISISASCPTSYLAKLLLTIYAEDYTSTDTFDLLIGETGFVDDMEAGSGLWTTDGTNNLWHISTRNAFSPTQAWYCGQESNGQYVANMDCYIQTVPFMVDVRSVLRFYRWFDVPVYGVDGIYVIIMRTTGIDTLADTLDFIGTGGALNGGGGRPIQSGWYEEMYYLPYPAGDTISVRISFVSDNEFGVGEGFYIDDVVVEHVTAVEEYIDDTVTTALLNVYPNPFMNKLDIRLQIPAISQKITLKVFDISGRLVRDIPLPHSDFSLLTSVVWDGTDDLNRDVPAGVYFVRLEAQGVNLTEKVILLR
ncbi:MAG: T9SS type A sorting domain-containing protein [candidate division WOR-3 bacterium]|nr:MAG: T9SS type A sorting domain-containing protein [candidate division WOR-3 bacterium]